METSDIEIVIIEDEEDILELLEYHLLKAGYKITGFLNTSKVEQFLEEEDVSLLIVDRNLPNVEGSEFIRYIRGIGYDIPVIFLSAKNRDIDIDKGFESGADDYITKPFRIKELLFRVEAILKRSISQKRGKLKYKDLILDLDKRVLNIGKRAIELTNLEFNLLKLFLKNPKQPLKREELKECWIDEKPHEKTINVAINRLKKKIDKSGERGYIVPVWGVGYKLK
jgi:DNA-binding response OmpR family regulator